MNWTSSDYLQLGLLVTTFLAVLVALFGEMFREWFKKPNISLKFDKKSDRCFRYATVPSDIIQVEQRNPFKNVERAYYRLKVKNEGGLAKNVKIKIDIFDSEEKEIQFFEPSTLRWISGKEREDLTKEEVNYVNICSQVIDHETFSQENINGFLVPGAKETISRRLRVELFDTSQRGIIWDLPRDNYMFKIMVYGDNFDPLRKNFEFKKPLSDTQLGDLSEVRVQASRFREWENKRE